MLDLIIIGGGVAGFTAAIYAARKKLDSLLIYKNLGGQAASTADIQNWPGTKKITGAEFGVSLQEHLKEYNGQTKENAEVKRIERIDGGFELSLEGGEKFTAKAIIIAAGKNPRKLKVAGSEKYEGKGIAYCSICDAPLYQGKNVAVVGGGNSGLEATQDLEKYADNIYLLEYMDKLNGDKLLVDKISQSSKVKIFTGTEIKLLHGENWVEKIIIKNRVSGQEQELNLQGIFVEIGYDPATEFVSQTVKLNDKKEIIVNPATNQTNQEGIFAAGDITDVKFKQIIIAAGEGAKAALSAEKYINESKN